MATLFLLTGANMSAAPDEPAPVYCIQCNEGGGRQSSPQAPSTRLVDSSQSLRSIQCIQVSQDPLSDTLFAPSACQLSQVDTAGTCFHTQGCSALCYIWSLLSLMLLWYVVLASCSVMELTSEVIVCVVVLRDNAGNRVRKQRALLFWTQQSLAAAFNAFRYLTCFASGATLLHGCHAIHVELMHHCCTAIKLCKSL